MVESFATVDDVLLLCWLFFLLGGCLGVAVGERLGAKHEEKRREGKR